MLIKTIAKWMLIERPLLFSVSSALLSISVLALTIFTVYLPQKARLLHAEQVLTASKREYAVFQRTQDYTNVADRYTDYLRSLAAKLLVQYSSAGVTGELTDLFSRSNVSVQNETYFQPENKFGVTRVEAAFLFSGRYEDVRKLLNGIYFLPFAAVVKEAHIEYMDGSLVTAEMSVEMFFAVPNAGAQ